MEILGIDVGGSGIKGALVNTETGELASKRLRVPTPSTFQPSDIIESVAELVQQLDYQGPIGVGFPAVVVEGTVMTPPTALAFTGWENYPVAEKIGQVTGSPTTVLNDADAAGLAEMNFGAGRGEKGVVMIFTLGTGIGSVLFVNGRMVPNLELGRVYLRNHKKTAEYQAADRVRKKKDLSWKQWGKRLNTYFNHIEILFSPQLIIIGGGVSKKHKKFLHHIKVRARVVPATLRNQAGIVGAAMATIQE